MCVHARVFFFFWGGGGVCTVCEVNLLKMQVYLAHRATEQNSFHGESLKPRFIQLVLSKVNGFGVSQERAVRTSYLPKIPDGGVLNLVTNGI